MTAGRSRSRPGSRGRGDRAQSNLVTLAVALLVVSTTTVLVVAVADGAIGRAERDVADRRVATALSERLVAPDAGLTARANVLNGTAVDRFDATRLRSSYPVPDDAEVRIRLDDGVLAETGDPVDGTTIRRVVLVQRRESITTTPRLSPDNDHATTLPRRTPRVRVRITPPPGTTVETVRANERVALHADSGLNGTYQVALSRFETTTFEFEANGPLLPGSVRIEYDSIESRKSTLVVTADG